MSEQESRFRERRSSQVDEPSEQRVEPTPTIDVDDGPTPVEPIVDPGALGDPAELELDALESSPLPEPSLIEIVSLLAEQAAVFLSGVPVGDGTERRPLPNQARHFIDLLTVLDDKTRGGQSPEEARQIEQILSQLRLAYLRVAG